MGKFICFEGIDGCGKTLQSKALAQTLKNFGFKVVLTREPGGKFPAGQKLRDLFLDPEINQDPRVALCLILANRFLDLKQVILPTMKKGNFVICDRFEGSTFAYQVEAGGLDFKKVKNFSDYLLKGMIKPDLTILLDVPVKTAQSRKKHQGIKLTSYDKQDLTFQKKLRQSYLKLAKLFPNWVVIDGTQSPERIQQEVMNVLKKHKIISPRLTSNS